ncbi:MAG: acyl-CoA thioesterase [Bacilli bacterium]|nr:acyl-CoA thioesterase [Bacilli bacterium]MBN2876983.1 acyl-CoA thioesterase [Bacilli bacterium]
MYQLENEVRYYETDMQKIVHHSNYLRWFELVRTKYLEAIGISILEIENSGVYYVLKEAHLDYVKPVKYGESVTLKCKLVKYNGIRLVHQYEISVNGEIRCTGETTLVNVNTETMLPINFKKANPKFYEIIRSTIEE